MKDPSIRSLPQPGDDDGRRPPGIKTLRELPPITRATPTLYGETDLLTRRERRLVALCEHINERPAAKRLQGLFHEHCGRRWVSFCVKNLLQVYDLHNALDLRPTRGVIVCSNHRTFFDMYVIATVLRNTGLPWIRDMYFPVRSNFFYESWTGLLINLLIGGGAMYPPIFRNREKAILNQIAVDRLVKFLQRPGVVVGMHPEGTRGKGPNPYELLRARPGVGQMALQANVTVLPVWINGLMNDLTKQLLSNFRTGPRRGQPIRVVFGMPVDLTGFSQQGEDTAVYQRVAERILQAIRALGERERAMSAGMGAGAEDARLSAPL